MPNFNLSSFNNRLKMTGAAMAETIIVFPIMMLVGFGIVHLGLIYQAKSNLEYAAFMASRQAVSTELGSLPDDADLDTCDGLCELKMTIRCRMAAFDPLPAGVVCNGSNLPADELIKVEIQFIRPAPSTFVAWSESAPDVPCGAASIGCYIPNNNLLAEDPTDIRSDPADPTGTGINIQDANIMTIGVRYLVDTGVPFMNGFFIGERAPTTMEDLNSTTFVDGPFGRQRNRPGVWITAESTMLMQTPATITNVNFCAIGGYC